MDGGDKVGHCQALNTNNPQNESTWFIKESGITFLIKPGICGELVLTANPMVNYGGELKKLRRKNKMMCQVCLKHKVRKLFLFAFLFLGSYSAAATDLALNYFQIGKPSIESPDFQLSIVVDNTSPINNGALNSPNTRVGFLGGLGADIESIVDPEGQVEVEGNIVGVVFKVGTVEKGSIYRFRVNLSKDDCGTKSPYAVAGVVSGARYDPDISNNTHGLLIVCKGDTASLETAGKIIGPVDLLLSN